TCSRTGGPPHGKVVAVTTDGSEHMAEDATKKENGKDEKEAAAPETPPPPHFEEEVVETTHRVTIGGQVVPSVAKAGRMLLGEEAKEFHHFKSDIEAVGEFIRIFLTRNERWASPKFIAGESYGTTRAAGLAGHLLQRNSMFLNGLILVSSILNFQTAGFDSK